HVFSSKATVVASGGYGRVFKTTSNAHASTGDCLSILLNRGLPLEDMEFFQFHPTGLYGLGILVTEGARGEGGILLNGHGERFMERYAPTIKDLAPRDMVSRAILSEVREGRGIDGRDYVHLDLTRIPGRIIEERLPEISTFCRIYLGIDPSEEPIPVLPTAHYAMGGIPTDIDGRVFINEKGDTVTGLYAAGECACVSVHGANRLGCNSLLDTVVFGRRAGMAIKKDINSLAMGDIKPSEIDRTISMLEGFINSKGLEKVGRIRSQMQKIMMDKCSVFRHRDGLKRAVEDMDAYAYLAGNVSIKDKTRRFNTELLEAIELQHLLNLAQAVARSSLQRTESRGAHYREDYPERDDKNWLKHTFIYKKDSEWKFSYRPVVIRRFQPEERRY
ncbi:MAG TPA: FAD-binding protein, partial [Nitrospirae bacterium]|nr:FAD-binding protein [Nitrospirota bacterium]